VLVQKESFQGAKVALNPDFLGFNFFTAGANLKDQCRF